MPVAYVLQDIIQRIELTDAERTEASRQQNVVRDALRQHLDVQRDFLTGSYARRTAIRPLDDIDLFVVLPTYPTLSEPPERAAHKIRDALARRYPSHPIRLQRRSVNIQFSQSGIGYDVVPAVDAGNDAYHIPDRDRGRWIRSAPQQHYERSAQANERAGGKLKPLIKLMKHWNRAHDKPLRSFHLEVMAYGAMTSPPPNYADGLVTLFGELAERVRRPLPDPARVGPDIDEGMDPVSRSKAARLLSEAADAVHRLNYHGDEAGLRRLLGL